MFVLFALEFGLFGFCCYCFVSLSLKKASHCVAVVGLELTVYIRLASNWEIVFLPLSPK